jgi:hypothetical protein
LKSHDNSFRCRNTVRNLPSSGLQAFFGRQPLNRCLARLTGLTSVVKPARLCVDEEMIHESLVGERIFQPTASCGHEAEARLMKIALNLCSKHGIRQQE